MPPQQQEWALRQPSSALISPKYAANAFSLLQEVAAPRKGSAI